MGIEGQNQNLKRSVIQAKPGNNVIIILFFATVQVIFTIDVDTDSEQTRVGFWARSLKEQAFVIKNYYNGGNQSIMQLGIYNAIIPMVYLMTT